MSTKTFKSARSTQELSVVKASGNNVRLMYCMEGMADRAIDLASTDIPALALAVLEAAGYTEHDRGDSGLSHFAIAKTNLRMGIAQQERATAAARKQAELEAEALELLNAEREALGIDLVRALSEVRAVAQEAAIAVARKARELRERASNG